MLCCCEGVPVSAFSEVWGNLREPACFDSVCKSNAFVS
jgi:hypothetical protein